MRELRAREREREREGEGEPKAGLGRNTCSAGMRFSLLLFVRRIHLASILSLRETMKTILTRCYRANCLYLASRRKIDVVNDRSRDDDSVIKASRSKVRSLPKRALLLAFFVKRSENCCENSHKELVGRVSLAAVGLDLNRCRMDSPAGNLFAGCSAGCLALRMSERLRGRGNRRPNPLSHVDLNEGRTEEDHRGV